MFPHANLRLPDVQGFWSESTLPVRAFEVFIIVMNFQALKFWYDNFRTKLTLGVLVAYGLAYGWAWFADLPFFLNMDFDPRFYGGFTIYGHWEPWWAGLGYMTLGLPLLHMMSNRENLSKVFGNTWAVYAVYWVGCSVSTTIVQVLFQLLGGMEYFYWKPGHLFFGCPWLVVFFMDPMMVMLPMFFISEAEKLNAQAEAARNPPKDGRIVTSNIEDAWARGSWSSFCIGIAAVNSGLYFMFCILVPLVAYVDPWTRGASSAVSI
jgi:hypothetical protein